MTSITNWSINPIQMTSLAAWRMGDSPQVNSTTSSTRNHSLYIARIEPGAVQLPHGAEMASRSSLFDEA